MHLMADAVAGLAEIDAVLFRHGGNVLVIVRVFKAGLQGIMVDIGHAALCFHPVNAHGFQLQIGHCPRGILRQRLIDPDRDFLARHQLALEQVIFQNFLCQIHLRYFLQKQSPVSRFFTLTVYLPCILYAIENQRKNKGLCRNGGVQQKSGRPISTGKPDLNGGQLFNRPHFLFPPQKEAMRRSKTVFCSIPRSALHSAVQRTLNEILLKHQIDHNGRQNAQQRAGRRRVQVSAAL